MINSIEDLDQSPSFVLEGCDQYLTDKEMLIAMEDFERKEATKDEEKYLLVMQGNITKDFSGSDKILLVQQANCCAVKLKKGGLADALSQVLPLSNPYLFRSPGCHKANLASEVTRDKFGSIKFVNNGKNNPMIVNMFAQYAMGPPHKYYMNCKVDKAYYNTCKYLDTKKGREIMFKECMNELVKWLLTDPNGIIMEKVVFPEGIGCASAGGDWHAYLKIILDFAKELKKRRRNIIIIIVKYAK
ncbi:uncharacterized protein [Cherax quadricarinatus]|uniref:uncharacterized protein n=1 Tax=Cherax quadricarinatus TaxID=27406 RepID=UPI00387EA87E